VTVNALRAGIARVASDAAPSSSMPTTATATGWSPALSSRSLLSWLTLLAGLNTGTWCRFPMRGTVSIIAVRKPSRCVRM